ncbi:hypothetical protein C1I95_28160 [Micromonospora craterilacus]|uniref:Uncharacterized protein n=1 Tax=Micromonospora craterilacus TaxID=1655439 RepID=A0A2W2EE45_9ACTN|nr:hypothetical protein [Micromonospora craterilacus]PZG10298.1 hypothetical protein C1I95_28160 [Micromonospora craterilacus]
MTRTPYTASILTTLGITTADMRQLVATHGDASPIGQCAEVINTTIWGMESAERAAANAVDALAKQTEAQAAAIGGNGFAFDPSWLTHYANKAAEEGARLRAGTEQLTIFKRLLDTLLAAAPEG